MGSRCAWWCPSCMREKAPNGCAQSSSWLGTAAVSGKCGAITTAPIRGKKNATGSRNRKNNAKELVSLRGPCALLHFGPYDFKAGNPDARSVGRRTRLWLTGQAARCVPGGGKLPSRDEHIARLRGETFDVAVMGGGINGAAVARDAAMRGLRVALIDRGDFAGQTSSRSSKLIHGGLRYLPQGQLRLVYEALRERERLGRRPRRIWSGPSAFCSRSIPD